jgi:tRNA/rRNA methyltransferase
MRPPAVILVHPQLAENIGMTARAMANFGLSELRLVAPRDGWPKKGAHQAASGATHVLTEAKLYPTVAEAVADLAYVLATSARARGQMKPVLGPGPALAEAAARAARGEACGVMFGPERVGLDNDAVALADSLVTFPVDPAFASLNLAQAVLLVAYEWRRASGEARLPFPETAAAPPASRGAVVSLLEGLEAALDAAGHYPPEKRPVMTRNMRDMILRMAPTEQDVRTLRGALRSLTRRRRTSPAPGEGQGEDPLSRMGEG